MAHVDRGRPDTTGGATLTNAERVLMVSNRTTTRLVLFAFALQASQTVALAAATIVTGASALVAQTFVAAADLAVQVFLLVGVRTRRTADATHPVGYGRERYFWSLYAALAIFVSGFTVTIEEVLRDALHPTPVTSFGVGYAVLSVNVVLDGFAFLYALRETKRRARARKHRLFSTSGGRRSRRRRLS